MSVNAFQMERYKLKVESCKFCKFSTPAIYNIYCTTVARALSHARSPGSGVATGQLPEPV